MQGSVVDAEESQVVEAVLAQVTGGWWGCVFTNAIINKLSHFRQDHLFRKGGTITL
ncbi:MAG: hypothetical protein NW224_21880 [Leptolyngbyaceae cyanobacterium bins.302]|nr:hypothetical protein [Leptolyngbyaceae cyanobacterium bins.302]